MLRIILPQPLFFDLLPSFAFLKNKIIIIILIETIVLNENSITGTLPPNMGELTYLKTINLSGNFLTGSIPNELVFLTGLGT